MVEYFGNFLSFMFKHKAEYIPFTKFINVFVYFMEYGKLITCTILFVGSERQFVSVS